MPITPKWRADEAKAAIRRLVKGLPEERQHMKGVADLMDLNSANISHLFMLDYLTPALERGLIQIKALEPRPEPIPVDPCPECGEVHIKVHCPYKRARKTRRPRFSVAADDPEMALAQLEKYYPGQFILKGNG